MDPWGYQQPGPSSTDSTLMPRGGGAGLQGSQAGVKPLLPRSAPFLCWLPNHALSLGFSPFLHASRVPPPSQMLETARCPGGREVPQVGPAEGSSGGMSFPSPSTPASTPKPFSRTYSFFLS